MANSPLGITFMPSADAAAAGPRQASIEGGPGGSDLAAAFKILSLHLPRVLGASAIAPKRLLTSPGSAGVQGGGSNPYSAVFQSLLQSMNNPSLSSIYGGSLDDSGSIGLGSLGGLSADSGGSAPPPKINFGDIFGAPVPDEPAAASPFVGGQMSSSPRENKQY